MKKILIDTDVILDFFFDRKPFSDDAAQVLALCESHEITGYVTPVIVSNVYYILRQTDGHQKVVDKLKQLLSITEILPTNKDMIHQALNSGFIDFEDAIQNFSAEMSGQVDVIITRNTKDFKRSNLGVMNPGTFLKILHPAHT